MNTRDALQKKPMKIQPIGRVCARSDDEKTLEIEDQYADALLGVEPGDKLQVLYWMHELTAEGRRRLRVHPRGDIARPIQGVFALRSPMRPNPIGVTVVEVVAIQGTCIVVQGLDALDGSPIIDLKNAG